MLVQLTITPVGSLHMSREVAKVVQIIKASGLTFQLGPMATCIEGDWDQLFGVIRQCHEAVAKSHERVITSITIDDRKHYHHPLAEMVTSVDQWHPRTDPEEEEEAL